MSVSKPALATFNSKVDGLPSYWNSTFDRGLQNVAGVQKKLQARIDHQMLESGLSMVLKALSGSLFTWMLAIMAKWGWARLAEEVTVQVDVPSFELPGYWLKTWLAQHQGDLGRMSRCSFKLKKQVSAKPSSSFGGPPPKAAQLEQDDDDFNDKPGGLAKTVAEFVFLPRAGSASTFLFEGHRVWVEERHDTSGGGGGGGRGGPPVMPFGGPGGNASQVFRLTTLGRSKHTICALLAAAKEAYEESLKSTTVIWSANPEQRFGSQAGWQKLDARPSRPMRTVLLEDGVAEALLEDVKSFMGASAWYYDRGIPYRRGYLLYGPPGCGKTSFLMALAGELHLTICIVNLSSKGLTDDGLLRLLSGAPKHAIILLEDVDAAFGSRVEPVLQPASQEAAAAGAPPAESEGKSGQPNVGADAGSTSSSGGGHSVGNRRLARPGGQGGRGGGGMTPGSSSDGNSGGITFSGLLNALDGVAAQEGKVLVMTTNHVERLDPALVRPGRIDIRCYFGLASRECAKKLFLRFYSSKETVSPTPSLVPSVREAAAANAREDESATRQDAKVASTAKEPGASASVQVVSEDTEAETAAAAKGSEASTNLEALADEFVAHLQSYTHSMATLQGHLMKFRHSPQAAAAHASSLNAAAEQNGGDATTAAAELLPLTSSMK